MPSSHQGYMESKALLLQFARRLLQLYVIPRLTHGLEPFILLEKNLKALDLAHLKMITELMSLRDKTA